MSTTGGTVLFLCTGNAARSVMAGVALREARPDLDVVTAGTLAVDGLPISWRTRAALESAGLPFPRHASSQAGPVHLDEADVVIGMAPEHVAWVRREHPRFADRAVTLKRLVDVLPVGPISLRERVELLDLASTVPGPDEEIVDPGGGEVGEFIACAHEIVVLVARLAHRL